MILSNLPCVRVYSLTECVLEDGFKDSFNFLGIYEKLTVLAKLT